MLGDLTAWLGSTLHWKKGVTLSLKSDKVCQLLFSMLVDNELEMTTWIMCTETRLCLYFLIKFWWRALHYMLCINIALSSSSWLHLCAKLYLLVSINFCVNDVSYSKGLVILHHNCVAVPIYRLLSAAQMVKFWMKYCI